MPAAADRSGRTKCGPPAAERVQRRVLQHAAGIKAQAQVMRGDLVPARHSQPVVAPRDDILSEGLLGDVVAASVRFRG
jgi:hypothetical protein